ncbi:MAG: histidine phosphatase family protein [Deltaproteobacteria bacterium]|jgi:broad specificity phosphatase PhoE|nr:histidine phosphatase family protein [Deltaproteobacteria bacterium]
MKRLRLYLLRHGETQTNGRYPFNGWTDVPLSDKGKAQLEAAARALAPVRFDRVISSDLFRARFGGELLAGGAGLKLETDPDWREMHFGECEGLEFEEIRRLHPELGESVMNPEGREVSFPGGESGQGFSARVAGALARLRAETPVGRVALVSHAGTARAVLAALFGFSVAVMWSFHQSHGCLHVVDVYPGSAAACRVLNAYLGPEGYASPGPGLDFLAGEFGGAY